jgi:hypothetical protein
MKTFKIETKIIKMQTVQFEIYHIQNSYAKWHKLKADVWSALKQA